MDLKKETMRIPVIILMAIMIVCLMMPDWADEAYAFSGKVGSRYTVTDGGLISYGPGEGGYSNSKKTNLGDGLGSRYSYCVQPDKPSPTATSVTVDRVVTDDADTGRWNAMRNIIYYSPSYPGYEDNVKNIKGNYYTGSFSKDWGIAHLALSYAYAGRPSDMATYGNTRASDLGEIWTKAKRLGDALWKDGTSRDDAVPESFKVFISYMDGVQNMVVGYMEAPGILIIKKTGTLKDITDDNPAYSLSGAVYTAYDTGGRAQGSVNTDKTGNSGELELSEGNYTVKETTAPEGYAKDAGNYSVRIISEEITELKVQDTPITSKPDQILKKVTKGFGKEGPEGDSRLDNAILRIRYYPAGKSGKLLKEWYFVTDENGMISGDAPIMAEGYESDSLYKNDGGETVFPLGTYIINEIAAPEGHLLSAAEEEFIVSEDGTGKEYTKGYKTVTFENDIIKGGVRVSKTDYELDEAYAQGDGTLENAEFTIYNNSLNAVTVGKKTFEKGEAVAVIKTDINGVAESGPDLLPYGTYTIKETRAPEGYLLNTEWNQVFSIRENHEIIDLTYESVSEKVKRGGIMVQKRDMELESSQSIGGASLADIKITIRNVSNHDVLVRNFERETVPNWDSREELAELILKGDVKRVCPGEDVGTVVTHWNKEKKAYTAETLSDDLPYGTYTLRESAANDSYQRTDKSEHRFEVREDGTLYTFDNGHEEILTFDDMVYRSDFYGIKIQDSTSKRMAHIPFKITSLTNGECHVAVTDKNGILCSGDRRTEDELDSDESSDKTRKENPFDFLLKENYITEDMIKERSGDILMGVWFGKGEYGKLAKMNSNLGSLPYDTYLVEEMSCQGNEGHLLQKFIFTVDEKSLNGMVNLGTVTDDVPEIRTSASVSGKKTKVQALKETVLTDKVRYSNLKKGETYRLSGVLIDKSTGQPALDPSGNEIRALTEFKAKGSSGKVKVVFKFNAESLKGKDTVVFERLYDAEGHLAANHNDINDTDQTVTWEETKENVPLKPEGVNKDKRDPVKRTAVPKTSDETEIMEWVLSTVTALAGFILAAFYMKGQKKRMPA